MNVVPEVVVGRQTGIGKLIGQLRIGVLKATQLDALRSLDGGLSVTAEKGHDGLAIAGAELTTRRHNYAILTIPHKQGALQRRRRPKFTTYT